MLPDHMELFGHALHAKLVTAIAAEIKAAEQGGLDATEALATGVAVLGNLVIVILSMCGDSNDQKELIAAIKSDLDNYMAHGVITHGNA